MLRGLGCAAVIFFCVAAKAVPKKAQTWQDRLAAAERLYDDYKYKETIDKLNALFKDAAFKDVAGRQKARALLGFSYFFLQRTDAAAEELQKLFTENLDYPIDRDATPPELLRFYEEQRSKLLPKPKEPEPTQPKEPEPKETPSEQPKELKVAPASDPVTASPEVKSSAPPVLEPKPIETFGDKHKWVRIFPGGIGHFLNHDYAGGASFLALELALGGTNLTMALLRESLRAPDGKFKIGTDPLTYQIVMNVAGLAALALVVIDIIDAFVGSPARGRASLAKSLTADLGPLGSYRLALTSAALP